MTLLAIAAIVCLLPAIGGATPAFAFTGHGAAAAAIELPDAPTPAAGLMQLGAPGSSGKPPAALQPAPVIQPCTVNASNADAKMSCAPTESPFRRFLRSPEVVPLTPKDKFKLAVENVFDPFNLLTIGADATIAVESNPGGVYGPGFRGISKYAGVSFTENMTGEFFGTFLVCSLAHQDPHYHRMPNVSVKRRIAHAFTQVVWTQSDTGRPMFNYANFLGGIATAAISNTFVPGPGRQGWGSTSQRLAVAFATSPSGNLITEFFPDVASHVNLHVVIFQRILNMVTREEGGM